MASLIVAGDELLPEPSAAVSVLHVDVLQVIVDAVDVDPVRLVVSSYAIDHLTDDET